MNFCHSVTKMKKIIKDSCETVQCHVSFSTREPWHCVGGGDVAAYALVLSTLRCFNEDCKLSARIQ